MGALPSPTMSLAPSNQIAFPAVCGGPPSGEQAMAKNMRPYGSVLSGDMAPSLVVSPCMRLVGLPARTASFSSVILTQALAGQIGYLSRPWQTVDMRINSWHRVLS